jgi:hypothetical protein
LELNVNIENNIHRKVMSKLSEAYYYSVENNFCSFRPSNNVKIKMYVELGTHERSKVFDVRLLYGILELRLRIREKVGEASQFILIKLC